MAERTEKQGEEHLESVKVTDCFYYAIIKCNNYVIRIV